MAMMRFLESLIRQHKERRMNDYRAVPPRPQDLTADKIVERMAFIKPGDYVTFDSMKECFTSNQVDRFVATIKATGEVVENCGGYLMVKLRRGVMESVNYFGIESVNGVKFRWYTPSAFK